MLSADRQKPAVIIFRDRLLRFSETFVQAQGEAIRDFEVYYAGSRRVPGIPVPVNRTLLLNDGKYHGYITEGLFKVFGIAPGFKKLIRQIRPSLIHAHSGIDGACVLPLARSLEVPLIVTFHGYDIQIKDEYVGRSHYLHRKYLRQRETLKRDCRSFIAVSEYIKAKLIEKGFPPEKIFVHYIGIDLKKFSPDPNIDREPVVLFVGRLIRVKGCEYLIRAMACVQKVLPQAKLVVIGDGPLREKLERQACESLSRFRFLGAQPPEVVREWMNRARVFSLPVITTEKGQTEAFGIVFAEAQAMGLPVASFSSGGVPEAVAHGRTGLLVPAGDCAALSRSILELLQDRELWQKFSENGRKRVHAMFDLERQTRRLEELYKAVCNGNG